MPSESPLFTSNQEHQRLLKALRESELLRELSELLASSLDPTRILQVLVKRTTEVCDVERCAVWLLDESRALFLPSAYHLGAQHLNRRVVQVADTMWHHSSLPFNDPIFHRLLQANGMVALEDLRKEHSMRTIAEKFFVHSVLLVALLREGRPVGMMSLDNPGKICSFTEEQQQLARAIGQQAAVAIDNAHLYQQAQAERKRAERLIGRAQSIYQVAMAVNSGEELSTVLEIATQHLIRDLEAEGAAIALLDNGALSIASNTIGSLPYALSPAIYATPVLTDLYHCYTATLQGTPLFVTQDQVAGIERQWFDYMGLENVIIVPLMVGPHSKNGRNTPGSLSSHCVGFAFISYSDPHYQPSHGHYAFAQDIAAQCALAIEKDQILEEARRAVITANEHANTLNAVFNAMTEGIIVTDMQGEVIITNSTAVRFMSVPSNAKKQLAAYLQTHPVYTFHGQPISQEDFPLSRALRGEKVRGERFITTRGDGSDRVVEVNIEPLYNSEAVQIGIVSAFRDITEQVRVERRVRRALDTMLHAAEAISGLTDIRDILNSVLAMIMSTLNCDRGAVQLYDQKHQTFSPLLSIGFSTEAEKLLFEEQKRWLDPEEGEYAGFRAQLLEGHATLVNAEQCPEQAASLQHTMALATPVKHNNQLLGVMLLDRSSWHNKEDEAQNAPNATRPLPKRDFNIWDMAVAEGIAQFAGLAIEQTRWQQEAEIAQTNEAIMREANALKDEFLAITAHEFRTPLTVVLAHSQMMARLLRRATSTEAELHNRLNESISIIEVQAHQLTNIVNTFLEVTRLNRGQITLTLEEIELEDVVQQVVANHSATSNMHHISSSIEPSKQPYLLMGDKARLFQIFANLLQNAIKYSPLGGPITIKLAQKIDDREKALIEVCVEDKGMGVPVAAQKHLFERFYRAPNIEGGKTRGVGLGLYVVAEFIRLHGGAIRVESSGIEGEGSRFIFTLPLLRKEENERDSKAHD